MDFTVELVCHCHRTFPPTLTLSLSGDLCKRLMVKLNWNQSRWQIILRSRVTESSLTLSVRGAFLVRPPACPASNIGSRLYLVPRNDLAYAALQYTPHQLVGGSPPVVQINLPGSSADHSPPACPATPQPQTVVKIRLCYLEANQRVLRGAGVPWLGT